MERLSIDEIIAHCERKVERIEKYNNGVNTIETASIDLPIVKEYWEHKQVAEYLKELKSYRDAEEQGLLLRLPCKVGTKVWYISPHNSISLQKGELYEGEVTRVYATESEVLIAIRIKTDWGVTEIPDVKDFGITVFLTKEEAEQKLAEMKGE